MNDHLTNVSEVYDACYALSTLITSEAYNIGVLKLSFIKGICLLLSTNMSCYIYHWMWMNVGKVSMGRKISTSTAMPCIYALKLPFSNMQFLQITIIGH